MMEQKKSDFAASKDYFGKSLSHLGNLLFGRSVDLKATSNYIQQRHLNTGKPDSKEQAQLNQERRDLSLNITKSAASDLYGSVSNLLKGLVALSIGLAKTAVKAGASLISMSSSPNTTKPVNQAVLKSAAAKDTTGSKDKQEVLKDETQSPQHH